MSGRNQLRTFGADSTTLPSDRLPDSVLARFSRPGQQERTRRGMQLRTCLDLSLVHGGCPQGVGHDLLAVAGRHTALIGVGAARVGQPSRKRFEVAGQSVVRPWRTLCRFER